MSNPFSTILRELPRWWEETNRPKQEVRNVNEGPILGKMPLKPRYERTGERALDITPSDVLETGVDALLNIPGALATYAGDAEAGARIKGPGKGASGVPAKVGEAVAKRVKEAQAPSKAGAVVDTLRDKAVAPRSASFLATPEFEKALDTDPVRSLFGNKHAEEAKIAKKVANLPEDSGKTVKRSREDIAKVDPDVYRRLYAERGVEPVLEAARRGEHLRPDASGGIVGAPRHVRSRQAVTQMRNSLDDQLARGADAISAAEKEAGTPERFGTWYPRAKNFHESINEPYQLPRWMEGTGTYSAGVAPESELAFNLKHWNSRALGEPVMAYRGAPMRALDEAVAQDRPTNLGFKIGEYARKSDPRVRDDSPFGVNDFRMAQSFGYTDPAGKPWTAGVSGTMHPLMDAETALLTDRANKKALGGVTGWTGERTQEIPWVAGKAQDLYERGKDARFAGGREGMVKALREANNTVEDYAYKHALAATHEATPGASTRHRADILEGDYDTRLKYGRDAPWTNAEGKDTLYSALGLRQLPSIEGTGAYINSAGKMENNPVSIARPLVDFATATEGVKAGSIAPATQRAVQSTERFRALIDAQEAGAANLPITAKGRTGRSNLLLDTRGANPHTGRQVDPQEMTRIVEALRDYKGMSPTATSRGVQILNFGNPQNTAKLRKSGVLQDIVPDARLEQSAHEGAYVKGMGPVEGSGGYTARALRHMTEMSPHAVQNLGESEGVRAAIRAKMLRDEGHPLTRADLQKTRQFFSEADWPKAVELMRQGMKPAAALAALGYSLSGMAAEQPQQPQPQGQ